MKIWKDEKKILLTIDIEISWSLHSWIWYRTHIFCFEFHRVRGKNSNFIESSPLNWNEIDFRWFHRRLAIFQELAEVLRWMWLKKKWIYLLNREPRWPKCFALTKIPGKNLNPISNIRIGNCIRKKNPRYVCKHFQLYRLLKSLAVVLHCHFIR